MFESLKWRMRYYPDTGRLEWIHNGKEVGGVNKSKGYRRFRSSKEGREYAVHRVIFDIMGVDVEDKQVDHINGIRDDNRWCNLRLVTPAENRMNTAVRGNKTGFKNVHLYKPGWWIARVIVDRVRHQAGPFQNIDDANEAAKELRAKLQGVYGCER